MPPTHTKSFSSPVPSLPSNPQHPSRHHHNSTTTAHPQSSVISFSHPTSNSSYHCSSSSAPPPQSLSSVHATATNATTSTATSSFGTTSSASTSKTNSSSSTASTLTSYSTGSHIAASNNVLNKRADKDTSLFQICLTLRQRLCRVPGFEDILSQEERDADDDTDPVTLLWRTFRRGFPLMNLYNALNPPVPLELEPDKFATSSEKKRSQAASFKFIKACVKELNIPQEECFIITDLYQDDTSGFVKVTRVVNRVLDRLVEAGLISPLLDSDTPQELPPELRPKKSHHSHVVSELVDTERTYVQHLELLQDFRKLVEERGIICGDDIHDIFLNLNALLDFQRRFLIRVEQTYAQPEPLQNWGRLFVLYRDAFKVYETYIANQRKCEEVVMREFDKLRDAGGSPEMQQMVESPTVLTSFLLKPFQRLAKYPLLLKELREKGNLNEECNADLAAGIEVALSLLQATNAAVDREERNKAMEELKSRVDDWKGHRIEIFGDLLMYGNFVVLKSDIVNSREPEREYRIYLFETILLCCKEEKVSRQKSKIISKPYHSVASSSSLNQKDKHRLQLKGRIFMQNVTETISVSRPGCYTCQIYWRGDTGVENFIVKFNTEEIMKKWAAQVEHQRRLCIDYCRKNPQNKYSTVSATEFTYMREHANLENPYRIDDDPADEDDDEADDADDDSYLNSHSSDVSTSIPGESSQANSRNRHNLQSNGNSRSHAITNTLTSQAGGPLPPPPLLGQSSNSRVPPPRFPMPPPCSTPPLQIRTQIPANISSTFSPKPHPGDVHFSPSVESPASTRTSISSTIAGGFSRSNASSVSNTNGHQVPVGNSSNFANPNLATDDSTRLPTSGGSVSRPSRAQNGVNSVSFGQSPPVSSTNPATVSNSSSYGNVSSAHQTSVSLPPPPLPLNPGSATLHLSSSRGMSQRPSHSFGSNNPISNPLIKNFRSRSASSPYIENSILSRSTDSQAPPPLPVHDLPPFRTHYAYCPTLPHRNNNSTSHVGGTNPNASTESLPRDRLNSDHSDISVMDYYFSSSNSKNSISTNNAILVGGDSVDRSITPRSYAESRSRLHTPTAFSTSSTAAGVTAISTPPPPSMAGSAISLESEDTSSIPSQLKVKVRCPSAGSSMTLVVSTSISFQTLKDRIDAKLQRSTSLSLSSGQLKLKYLDENDFVSIQSDEDVQTAFEMWREQQRDQMRAGQLGEIELYCQR